MLRTALRGMDTGNSPAASASRAPHSEAAGKSTRWFVVRKSMKAKCGTAMPMNATGPQYAVAAPASKLEPSSTQMREGPTRTPSPRAKSSPMWIAFRESGNGAEREAPKTPESPRHIDLQAFRIGARHENVHERVHEITDEKSRHKEHRTVSEPRGEDEYDLRNKHSTCGSGTQDAEGAETEAREKRDRHP